MSFFQAMQINASALSAQTVRMNALSSNLANVNTTRTPEGGPYLPKAVIFQAQPNFERFMQEAMSGEQEGVAGVGVEQIISQEDLVKEVYDPAHPDADEQGYVSLPDINVVTQITDIMSASRAYEANVNGLKAAQRMALKALEIGG
ncbi:MAG: flagellar basal body rod protein FlgC [Desulfovermiculus sp.]